MPSDGGGRRLVLTAAAAAVGAACVAGGLVFLYRRQRSGKGLMMGPLLRWVGGWVVDGLVGELIGRLWWDVVLCGLEGWEGTPGGRVIASQPRTPLCCAQPLMK